MKTVLVSSNIYLELIRENSAPKSPNLASNVPETFLLGKSETLNKSKSKYLII